MITLNSLLGLVILLVLVLSVGMALGVQADRTPTEHETTEEDW